ncbi:MAG TPA: phosphoribosylanthranilate isomerase [Candidatus Dormibacteraeota bacterium]
MAVSAGADLIGMHFCSSLRRIDLELGREIARAVEGRATLVGVFIDAEGEEVRGVAAAVGLDLVQLHGEEPPGDYARPVLKALKVRDGALPDAGAWPDPILLDTWSADGRGGTGVPWSWDLARDLVASRRVMIAGGLTPANVGEVVASLHPYGVDVSSGVESEPRHKDPARVRAFVQAVRDADRA